MNNNNGYYITPDDKILYVRKSGTIVHENTFPRETITEEVFNAMEKRSLKKTKANELLNIFYRTVEHTWKFDKSTYRKLPNFENDMHAFNSNYPKMPIHELDIYGSCYLVWFRGRVYYHTITYGGYPQGQLVDVNTKSAVQWIKLKHCAPILNVNTNKLM